MINRSDLPKEKNKKSSLIIIRISNWLVNKRIYIFVAMMIFMVVCLLLIPHVTTNNDMASFLPEDSSMRQGLEIMQNEWPTQPGTGGGGTGANARRDVLLMVEGLPYGEDRALYANGVRAILIHDNVVNINHQNNHHFNTEEYALFIVTVTGTRAQANELLNLLAERVRSNGFYAHTYQPGFFDTDAGSWMLPISVILMISMLFIMCKSFFEPILLFLGVGVAVIMNLGTNIILPSISSQTSTVAITLQLMMSIVCSLILLTRYRTEKEKLAKNGVINNVEAMKLTLSGSTKTIVGACTATMIGLLSLTLMSFGIGTEMGIIFAKGVLFTVVCVYTVMPALILWCDKIITFLDKDKLFRRNKTKKGVDNVNL